MLRVSFLLKLLIGALGVLAVAGGAGAQGWEDNFDATSPRWTWRAPVPGPTCSLTEHPGWLRVTIPQRDKGYNHWNNPLFDDAPQLRTAVPDGDWVLEARVVLVKYDPFSHFSIGLLVGMTDQMVLTLGQLQGPGLTGGPKVPEARLEVTGTSGLFKVAGESKDLNLRLARKGNTFAAFVQRPGEEWLPCGRYTFPQPPQFLGLIGKTFSEGPGVTFDVDYVKLSFPQAEGDAGPAPLPPVVAPANPNPPAPQPENPAPQAPGGNPPVVPAPSPSTPLAPVGGGLESSGPPAAAPVPSGPAVTKAGPITPQMITLGKRICDWGEEHLREGKYADAEACFRVVLLYLPESTRAKTGLTKALAGKP